MPRALVVQLSDPPAGGDVRPPGGASVILVDQNTDLQSIIGWSGTAQLGDLSTYRAEVVDRAINELGLNAVRLSLRSGSLRNNDVTAQYVAGQITANEERFQRFAPQTGTDLFKPGFLIKTMDEVIEPLRDALLARGETLYINLTLTDYNSQGEAYYVNVNAPSGQFDDDEAVSWSGGSGTLIGRPNASSTMLIMRDGITGSAPSIGATITGAVSGVTAVTSGAASVAYRGDYQMREQPARAAELVLACIAKMITDYGYGPDAVTIMNEPDATAAGWSATQTAAVVEAVGAALAGAGHNIPISGASTARDHNAVSRFNTIWDYLPGSSYPNRSYVSALSYHRYGNNLLSDTKAIGAKRALGVQTWMTEWGISTTQGAIGDTLHLDLKWAEISLFEQLAIAFGSFNPVQLNDKSKYYSIDHNDATPATAVQTQNESKKFQQYFRFIRRNAVRKATSHTNCGTPDATNEFYDYDGLAFRNANGKYVVVVRTRAAGDVWIDGLPAGTYGIEYTVGTAWHQTKPDVTIGVGDALSFNSASATVSFWTIFQR